MRDKNKSFICCLHAGWKGTLMNIVQNAIKKIKTYNKNLNGTIAIIGPCLAEKNFEVKKNFKEMFVDQNAKYINFFSKKNNDKDLFNIRGLISFQLKQVGITKVYNLNEDTYENSHLFFSHRRTLHEDKVFTGRMINIISFA